MSMPSLALSAFVEGGIEPVIARVVAKLHDGRHRTQALIDLVRSKVFTMEHMPVLCELSIENAQDHGMGRKVSTCTFTMDMISALFRVGIVPEGGGMPILPVQRVVFQADHRPQYLLYKRGYWLTAADLTSLLQYFNCTDNDNTIQVGEYTSIAQMVECSRHGGDAMHIAIANTDNKEGMHWVVVMWQHINNTTNIMVVDPLQHIGQGTITVKQYLMVTLLASGWSTNDLHIDVQALGWQMDGWGCGYYCCYYVGHLVNHRATRLTPDYKPPAPKCATFMPACWLLLKHAGKPVDVDLIHRILDGDVDADTMQREMGLKFVQQDSLPLEFV